MHYVPLARSHQHTVFVDAAQHNLAGEVFYKCGSDDGWSPTFSFNMPQKYRDGGFGISMFGDMGYLGSHERPMEIVSDGLERNWTAVPTRQQIVRWLTKQP